MIQLESGDSPQIHTIEELLAHAHALEAEAVDRYNLLADQMEAHNNMEVAELFRKMAVIEGKHVERVNHLSEGRELPHISPWDHQWEGESPEALDSSAVHYLMTPHHALQLAVQHEKQAADFYAEVVETASEEEVRDLAKTLAAEEHEHVALLQKWLEKVPEPDEDWAEDPDPPTLQE